MGARFTFRFLAPLAVVAFSGCGYVHVGRLPAPVTTAEVTDEKLVQENNDLRLERKILQQELALTRAQGDALRTALENRAAEGETTRRLVDKLNETTRELAALRETYAQLQAEKAATGDPALTPRLGATEEKLAESLRNYTEAQQEIARLRTEISETRAQNASLGRQVKLLTLQNQKAQAALAQLNSELLVEKDARVRAEQDAETLRTELANIAPDSSVLARLRTGSAADARSLAPGGGGSDRAAAESPVVLKPIAPQAPVATIEIGGVHATLVSRTPTNARPSVARVHLVSSGDTLAKISSRYYGTPGRWSDILAANRDVLGEHNTLVIGRTLRIP